MSAHLSERPRRPMPATVGPVPDFSAERAPTADGLLLGMRRYPRPGAPPVLLLHGLAQNLQGWDLPVEGHSLARHLSAAGFDVWLGNFRGHGRDPHRSNRGPRAPRIDDFGLRDVPAFIRRVQRCTGQRPLVVAHSMGGIASLMYLQGATIDAEGRVGHAPELAERRNASIAGIIMVGVPPAMVWHGDPGVKALFKGRYFESNYLMQRVVARRPARALLKVLPGGRFPAGKAASVVRKATESRLLKPMGHAAAHVLGQATSAALVHTLWNPNNMNSALVHAESLHTLEDVSWAVLEQFTDWIAHGTMRAHVPDQPEALSHIYAEHHHHLTAPVLWVAGDLDRVSPPSVMRSHGLARVGSQDAGMVVVKGFGHNDLRMGEAAPTVLYPHITRWLTQRAERVAPPGWTALQGVANPG